MSSKVEISPSFLREKYHEQGWTLSEIADEVGCSIGTVHNRMEEHDIARQNPKAWKERICVECAHCGKEKRIEQWQYEAHERFFCDNECQGAFLAETGLSRGENNGRWKEKITVECANCGDELSVYLCRLKEKENHLCDQSCRAEWYSANLSGSDHPLWEPGNNRYSGRWLSARRYVRARDGNRCQLCERSASALRQAPDVHHIKPVRSYDDPEDAHVPENLVQLCRSCHTRVEQLRPREQRDLLAKRGVEPFTDSE